MGPWISYGFLNVTKGSDPFVTSRGEVVLGEEEWRMVLSTEWEVGGIALVRNATKGSDPFDAFRPAWLLFDF
jgi:hypothetical protein